MGLHPSLRRSNLGGSRSVMSRTKRVKWLIEKGQWTEGSPVLGLPKIKIVKLKAIKKEKQKTEEAVSQPVEGEQKPPEKP